MAAEGGEVVPDFTEPTVKPAPTFEELKPTPAPAGAVPSAPPLPPKNPVVMKGARPVGVMSSEGPRPPGMAPPPKETPEQAALVQQIDQEINFELNVLHMCYGATRNLINRLRQGQPPDAADFAQFSAEKRTPLEIAEPQMALEVYRQVRDSLRHAQAARAVAAPPTDTISVLAPGLNAALVALSREKP